MNEPSLGDAPERDDRPLAEKIEDARAGARTIAEGVADAALLEAARNDPANHHPACHKAFYDEFVVVARATPERQSAWVEVLRMALLKARDALLSTYSSGSGGEQFVGASEQWRTEQDPFSVWASRSPNIHAWKVHGWAELLLAVHMSEGLRALDMLPYPGLIRDILIVRYQDDAESIQQLIRTAPLVFDERGEWVPERSFAALLVVDLITQRAQARGGAATPTEAWMVEAFRTLLRRSDGLSIALGYLGYLGRRVLGGEGQPATAYMRSMGALVVVLRAASVDTARVHYAWKLADQRAATKSAEDHGRSVVRPQSRRKRGAQEGEGARTLYAHGLPYLWGAGILLLGAETPDEAEIVRFWSWFEELLQGRDPGLNLINNGTSLTDVPQRIGTLLSYLPEPGAILRRAYAKLEPQRRRALFGLRYEGIDHDLESEVLLRVGLYTAVEWLARVKTGEPAEAARALFFWIYERARQLWLTRRARSWPHKSELVTNCFSFVPFLLGDNLEEALKQAIPPIAGDPRMLAEACANLRRNGVEPPRLRSLIADAGANLETALRDAQQWSELTGRSELTDTKEDFPEHLQKLAAELGIDFARPVVPPESERTRAMREAFRAAIPWANALLDRLDADGCSHVRVLPLDQPGTTWVLQATLPDALRERFGLAPDLRVLAVHGQLRGRDLRLAVEEPEGAADVDPDLLVIANQTQDLPARLARVVGPWGQRVPWPASAETFAPLAKILQECLPAFDIFEHRDPVHGRAFLGRRREIDAIVTRLLRGEAVGAFGLRKVGKSSLLDAVTQVIDPVGAAIAVMGRRARIAGEVSAQALVVSLDVQGLVVRTRDVLARRLWDGLRERLAATGLSTSTAPPPDERPGSGPIRPITALDEAPSEDPLENLRRLLTAALANPDVPAVCFVIDEYDLLFEGYGGEPAVAGVEQILALLRQQAQATGRVSVALIGRDPVFVKQPLVNGFTNPLLGWVAPFHLGPFSDEDAAELLHRLGRRVGMEIDDATIALALRWTGGHPLLLREYGSALYEIGRASRNGETRARAAEAFLLREAVQTICGEIEVLLETRFPDALALLRELTRAPEVSARAVLAGGGRAAKVLFDFGILRGTVEAPWVPLLYRDVFGVSVPESQTLPRRQAQGSERR